jgi:transcriptional regulator with XRE-family HTH domain
MSHFSTELRVLLDENGLSQTALHKKTRVSQGSISRYLNEVIAPDWRAVEKLGAAFPDRRHRARLIAAHARDVVHPSLIDKINAGGKLQGAEKHERQNPRDRMPAKMRAAYDKLGAAAIEHAAVADLIHSLAAITNK